MLPMGQIMQGELKRTLHFQNDNRKQMQHTKYAAFKPTPVDRKFYFK